MESLIIEATEDSPQINFDINKNEYSISGKSRPENTGKFYAPVLEWLDSLGKIETKKPITFSFKLEYFNSISAKYIADIIMLLKEAYSNEAKVEIKWYYPKADDDMLEVGKEFSDMAEMDFDYIAY